MTHASRIVRLFSVHMHHFTYALALLILLL